jgi:hypothetical protein
MPQHDSLKKSGAFEHIQFDAYNLVVFDIHLDSRVSLDPANFRNLDNFTF